MTKGTKMQFRPAQRSEAKPLIGLYSESGAGKTYSALLLARGFVGPTGRIGMIETESGRGEAYADPNEYPDLAGDGMATNYEVLSLREDFSPRTYGEAITAAEQAKFDALIIDSASHEWESAGGVLDMAANNQAGGKKGVLVWQQPKIDHQRFFMLRFMQTPIPLVILCMRAKYPMREVPKPNGGKEWIRSEHLDPKQSEDILFEMFVHGWIGRDDNVFHLTKCTSKALEPIFGGGRPISLDTGKMLSEWAAGTTGEDHLSGAREAATQGKDALQAYWKGLTQPQRATVKPFLDELKATAIEADTPDEPEEELFDKEAGLEAFVNHSSTTHPYLLSAGPELLSLNTEEAIDAWWDQEAENREQLPEDVLAAITAMRDERLAKLSSEAA